MASVTWRAFAADRDGTLLAALDGPELLVWGGADLQPMWKQFASVSWVDVAVDAGAVWTLDLDGVVEQRRRADGELQRRTPLVKGPGVRLALRGVRIAACSAREVVWIIDEQSQGRVMVDDVVALSWSADGHLLAAAEAAGAVTIIDTEIGEVVGRVSVGGPPVDVDWCVDGYWNVSVGRRLRPVRIDGGKVAPPRTVRADTIRQVTEVAEGGLLALLVGPRQVEIATLDLTRMLGTITVGRDIVGIAGGGQAWLFLGLEHGDLERVDLFTGSDAAAVPHEGRARVMWPSDVRIDTTSLRGVLVHRRVGDAPIAEQLDPDAPPESPWWVAVAWFFGGLMVFLVAAVVVAAILRMNGIL